MSHPAIALVVSAGVMGLGVALSRARRMAPPMVAVPVAS